MELPPDKVELLRRLLPYRGATLRIAETHPEVLTALYELFDGVVTRAARFLGCCKKRLRRAWQTAGLEPNKNYNVNRIPDPNDYVDDIAYANAYDRAQLAAQMAPPQALEELDRFMRESSEVSDGDVAAILDQLGISIDDDFDSIWRAVTELQDALKPLKIERRTTTWHIPENKPIGIAALSDMHIGADGTDYRVLGAVLKLIYDTDGMYMVCHGDIINNYISRSPDTERHSQVLSPAVQKELAKRIMEHFGIKKKVIAITRGQHEAWSIRQDDFDPAAYFAKHADAAYLGPGGVVHAEFPDGTKYVFGIWHKYRGSSIYDETARAKRAYREHGAGQWDVTIVGDKHTPAVSYEIAVGKLCAFVCSGAAKLGDMYADDLGYIDQRRFMVPVVIIWPEKRKMWLTLDFVEGVQYLEYVRRAWDERAKEQIKQEIHQGATKDGRATAGRKSRKSTRRRKDSK